MVTPLSGTLQYVFGHRVSIAELSSEDRLLLVKETIRRCGGQLKALCTPLEHPCSDVEGKYLSLCTISSTETSETSLLVTTNGKFHHYVLTYRAAEDSQDNSQKTVSSCSLNPLNEEEMKELLAEQPHIAVHIIRTLLSALRAKREHHSKLAQEFDAVNTNIGRLESTIHL